MRRTLELSWTDLTQGARLLAGLPGFVRRPIELERAGEMLDQRLRARTGNFLALARRTIYSVRTSPYHRLLATAGCEYGDLERLVAEESLESALGTLARRGVYLTVEELKGRQPVVRGSSRFDVTPASLANPGLVPQLVLRSSGSRGAATAVPLDLAHLRDHAPNTALSLAARGGWGWRHAMWVVPGGAAMILLLRYAALGNPPSAWFSQLDPASRQLDPRYTWSTRLLRWGSRAAGLALPRPVHVPPGNPLPIVEWLRRQLRAGDTPHLLTFPSSAAELCQAAQRAGIDLTGAHFSIGGEPVTAARLAAIRAVGVAALPHYGCMEAGFISEGCLQPEAPDEVHLFHDLNAVILAGAAGPGAVALPPNALLLTSLRPTAPLILLNVSLGDQARVSQRRCGCPLERTGWTTHLQAVRSFEKLTAGGMTFLDSEAIVALEETLPGRFGGLVGDYQLIEEADPDGRPRLVLLVSPRVGLVDAAAVGSTFLAAIGASSPAARLTELFWRESGTLQVERREPVATASGKVLHLHAADRRAESLAAEANER